MLSDKDEHNLYHVLKVELLDPGRACNVPKQGHYNLLRTVYHFLKKQSQWPLYFSK